jgi:cytochrome c-type biogenesis protein CcmH/NrfG
MNVLPESLGRAWALLFVIATIIAGAVNVRAQDSQAFVETLQQATAKSQAKEWKEATAAWQRVVEANPVKAEFWLELANAAYEGKDYRRSIAAYEKSDRTWRWLSFERCLQHRL